MSAFSCFPALLLCSLSSLLSQLFALLSQLVCLCSLSSSALLSQLACLCSLGPLLSQLFALSARLFFLCSLGSHLRSPPITVGAFRPLETHVRAAVSFADRARASRASGAHALGPAGARALTVSCSRVRVRGRRHSMKIAIVGTGVAGIGAAWLLSQEHEVVMYEKDDYIGGHTHTIDVPVKNGATAYSPPPGGASARAPRADLEGVPVAAVFLTGRAGPRPWTRDSSFSTIGRTPTCSTFSSTLASRCAECLARGGGDPLVCYGC